MPATEKAQSITGKWKCPKDFLDSMGLLYDMKGHYRFKKNGTFQVKINGIKRVTKKSVFTIYYGRTKKIHSKHAAIFIKVRGTYKVIDGAVTTSVSPDDVYCFIDPGREQPDGPDADDSEYVARSKEYQQRLYDAADFDARVQAETIKNEVIRIWQWYNEPVTVTKDSLIIGDKATFLR